MLIRATEEAIAASATLSPVVGIVVGAASAATAAMAAALVVIAVAAVAAIVWLKSMPNAAAVVGLKGLLLCLLIAQTVMHASVLLVTWVAEAVLHTARKRCGL